MKKRKKTAFERERERIMRIERRLIKQGYIIQRTEIPTLKVLKARGFKGQELNKYVRQLKAINKETLLNYVPDAREIVYSNFEDEFLLKYAKLDAEEEDLFYGLQGVEGEQYEEERKRQNEMYENTAQVLLDTLRAQKPESYTKRSSWVIELSRQRLSLICDIIEELGYLKVGENLLRYNGDQDINYLISLVSYASNQEEILGASFKLITIIKGTDLTFDENTRFTDENAEYIGW